jgi:alkaline phosphatase D
MAALLQASSPELVDVDTKRRGWSKVTLTPDAAVSQWRFLSTVLERDFTVNETEPLVAKVGARRFG